MSRDSAGTYSLPAGNPVSSGDTISSTTHNNTMADIAAELTDSLSRSGKGGMSAPLELVDGTASAPGLSFNNDTNTGLYRPGADELNVTIGGDLCAAFVAEGLEVYHASADDPAITLYADNDTALARLIHTGTTDLRLKSLEHGVPVYLAGEDSGGSEQLIVGGDPDGASVLYHAGVATFRTKANGAQYHDGSNWVDVAKNDHDALVNFVANEHIDHSSVSISAGTGLTGGGNITTSRTLSLDTSNTRNVDHSSVSIVAGNGLTGGGTITTNRTLNVGAGNGISVSADAVAMSGSFTGTFTASGDVRAGSDLRQKEHLEVIPLGMVEKLQGYHYWRKDLKCWQYGVIAQDVRKVIPEAVAEAEDGMLSVAYNQIVAILVEEVKALKRMVYGIA